LHSLRVDHGRWQAAMAKARSEGRTLTDVINCALADYIGEAPRRPARDAETRQREREKRAVPQASFSDPPVNPLLPPAPGCGHPRARRDPKNKDLCRACGQVVGAE
jgi:hypothetical protein